MEISFNSERFLLFFPEEGLLIQCLIYHLHWTIANFSMAFAHQLLFVRQIITIMAMPEKKTIIFFLFEKNQEVCTSLQRSAHALLVIFSVVHNSNSERIRPIEKMNFIRYKMSTVFAFFGIGQNSRSWTGTCWGGGGKKQKVMAKFRIFKNRKLKRHPQKGIYMFEWKN